MWDPVHSQGEKVIGDPGSAAVRAMATPAPQRGPIYGHGMPVSASSRDASDSVSSPLPGNVLAAARWLPTIVGCNAHVFFTIMGVPVAFQAWPQRAWPLQEAAYPGIMWNHVWAGPYFSPDWSQQRSKVAGSGAPRRMRGQS